jgi:hypothetical protein
MSVTAKSSAGPFLYNPALMPREELIASFLVRHSELEEVLRQVRAAQPQHAPQHVLVIGFRGMGKTTLLHRAAYAVEEDPELSRAWLPVLFDEEQFNVGELADFWLNALEALSVSAGRPDLRCLADDLAEKFREEALEEAAFSALRDLHLELDRRLLLLVDNVDLIFDRIGSDREASRLREVLQHEPWMLLVGSSSRVIEATYEYGQPFYEMFKVIELQPLEEEETLQLLSGLAEQYQATQVSDVVRTDPARLAKLRLLMGGNPRTVGLLFGVLKEGPTEDLRDQLQRLLDGCTSLYKERLESLPIQAQRVFDALAQRWNPATAEDIADDLRIGRGTASGQLHRLVDKGLVEKIKLPGRSMGFQVRERFFNVWCLMRGGRRGRQRLRWLVEAVELFYDVERIRREVVRIQDTLASSENKMQFSGAAEVAQVLAAFLDPDQQANVYRTLLAGLRRFPGEGHTEVDLEGLRRVALNGELAPVSVVDLLEQLKERTPRDPQVWWRYVIAQCQARINDRVDFKSLALEAERALDISMDSLEVNLAIGTLFYFAEWFDRSEYYLRKALEQDPGNASAWNLLTHVHLASGNPRRAIEVAERAVCDARVDVELVTALLILDRLAPFLAKETSLIELLGNRIISGQLNGEVVLSLPLTSILLSHPDSPSAEMAAKLRLLLEREAPILLPYPEVAGIAAAILAADKQWENVASILFSEPAKQKLASAIGMFVVALPPYFPADGWVELIEGTMRCILRHPLGDDEVVLNWVVVAALVAQRLPVSSRVEVAEALLRLLENRIKDSHFVFFRDVLRSVAEVEPFETASVSPQVKKIMQQLRDSVAVPWRSFWPLSHGGSLQAESETVTWHLSQSFKAP